MKIALDTNVLAYAEGVNGKPLRDQTVGMLRRLSRHDVIVPVQVLGELFAVLQRKAQRAPREAKAAILGWSDAYQTLETTATALFEAADLVSERRLSFWDSVILTVAAQAQCRFLFSEDMQDGFTWRGTTVANPYAENLHPLLRAF